MSRFPYVKSPRGFPCQVRDHLHTKTDKHQQGWRHDERGHVFFGHRFLKDSECLGSLTIQPPVVNHRGGCDFRFLLIVPSIHQAVIHATSTRLRLHLWTTPDSALPRFTTRLPLMKESFLMEDEAGLELPHSVWGPHLPHHGEDHLPHGDSAMVSGSEERVVSEGPLNVHFALLLRSRDQVPPHMDPECWFRGHLTHSRVDPLC